MPSLDYRAIDARLQARDKAAPAATGR